MSQPIASARSNLFSVKPPLELVALVERGTANTERIYLKANERVRLNAYFLMAGAYLSPNDAMPLTDHVFWLGNRFVESGTWVLVYTGPGAELITSMEKTKEPVLVLHWGKQYTIFGNVSIVPCLVRIDSAPGSIQVTA